MITCIEDQRELRALRGCPKGVAEKRMKVRDHLRKWLAVMTIAVVEFIISTYTKTFLYPTLEFAQCRMLWDDDLLRHGSRHKNGLRAASTEAGVQRRCDSSKG